MVGKVQHALLVSRMQAASDGHAYAVDVPPMNGRGALPSMRGWLAPKLCRLAMLIRPDDSLSVSSCAQHLRLPEPTATCTKSNRRCRGTPGAKDRRSLPLLCPGGAQVLSFGCMGLDTTRGSSSTTGTELKRELKENRPHAISYGNGRGERNILGQITLTPEAGRMFRFGENAEAQSAIITQLLSHPSSGRRAQRRPSAFDLA
jgi:hypothetical protein